MNKTLITDFGLLILRLSIALPMLIQHGWPKLANYSLFLEKFGDPIGLGAPVGFALLVFAEVFCSLGVALGLLSRFAALPPAFAMGVAFFVAKSETGFGERELPFLYMMMFTVIVLTGAGRFSVDRFLFGRKGSARGR